MFRCRRWYHLERNKFGNLLPPRDKTDKLRHQQVLDRIPFDLADGWFERNEIILEKNLKIMPKQFAESVLKYNKSDVDVILESLLEYCVSSSYNRQSTDNVTEYTGAELRRFSNASSPGKVTNARSIKSPNTALKGPITQNSLRNRDSLFSKKDNDVSINSNKSSLSNIDMEKVICTNSFIYNISSQIENNIEYLNSSECGIILKCFSKINYRNMELTVRLLERLLNRLLNRGEQFSKYGLLYGLATVVDSLGNGECSTSELKNLNDNAHNVTLRRFFTRLLGLVMDNLDKFDLNITSQIVNIVSRCSLGVDKELNRIADYVLNNFGTSITNTSVVNGVSRVLSNGTNGGSASDSSGWTENVVYYLANGFARKSILRKPLFDLFSLQILEDNKYLTYGVDSLVSICNSFSKFGNVIDSGYLDLYVNIADVLVTKPGRLNSVHVSVLCNAYSRVCVCHEPLFRALMSRFVLDSSLAVDKEGQMGVFYSPRQIAMILHSVVKLGYKCASLGYLFDQATKNLNVYCWQSLTMLFQSYCKSDYMRSQATEAFVDHFYKRLTDTTGTEDSVSSNNREGYGKTTLLSLVYSLVKTNTLYHVHLLELLAAGIKKCIEEYIGDEVVNLVYSFCKIYRHSTTNQLKQLETMALDILRRLMVQIKSNKINSFSMVKIVKAFGDIRLIEASDVVLNLVKSDIQLIDKLSYQQINTVIFAFSVLGINDMDLLTVLNTIKYRKKTPQAP